ncbi:ribosomal 40S subunit protein S13 [Stygiomarasmius scandens]|uniref:Ribosomal 40S subunit protein S13 n=1 Tax=Marasmiellus scandens TaxID=2682957 RepID=A0ABR1J1M6_9AGAR
MGRTHASRKGISSSALPYRRLVPSVLENLWHLIKEVVTVRKHLEFNREDKDSKFCLILIESRVHYLARYYKTKQQIPPSLKYDSATAVTMIILELGKNGRGSIYICHCCTVVLCKNVTHASRLFYGFSAVA